MYLDDQKTSNSKLYSVLHIWCLVIDFNLDDLTQPVILNSGWNIKFTKRNE